MGFGLVSIQAQEKQIQIVYGGNFTKDETQFPGASIFSKDDKQVQFNHEGADLWCDVAIFYPAENRIKAKGNITLIQGDSIFMNAGSLDYNGVSQLAKAWRQVSLRSSEMTLTPIDTLYFDRLKQEAYYTQKGTIVDAQNTLTSDIGRYYLNAKKYQFLSQVEVVNPEYKLRSTHLNYYTNTKNAYMYGPSTIYGKDYTFYCERGFYNTIVESGYGIKNTKINYNNRVIKGDSVYFNKRRQFASATNNITVTDTINKGVIRAHYAEVFKAKDSVFATKKAVSISLVEKDSLYMHGDTIMLTGKPEARILRAFRDAKFYKTDLSGKCDSIHFNQKTGLTQLIKRPIIWNGENQMTGDIIHLKSDPKTKSLDSLKVLNNAFIVALDTIRREGYNQAKGKDMFGVFEKNALRFLNLIKNTELIYYLYDGDQELMGINKTICSEIAIEMVQNEISEITFITAPDGTIYPLAELPEIDRKLEGFLWFGSERIRNKEDIFDLEDLNVKLVKINGLKNDIDIESLEKEKLNTSDASKVKTQNPTPYITKNTSKTQNQEPSKVKQNTPNITTDPKE
jgi:lipopolysaccharide export system protein LptA